MGEGLAGALKPPGAVIRRIAPPSPEREKAVRSTIARNERSMTETRISSATHEVVIGFERRFVMIGERINPTGRKLLAAEMA